MSDETNQRPSDAAEFLEAPTQRYENSKWEIDGKIVDMNAIANPFAPDGDDGLPPPEPETK